MCMYIHLRSSEASTSGITSLHCKGGGLFFTVIPYHKGGAAQSWLRKLPISSKIKHFLRKDFHQLINSPLLFLKYHKSVHKNSLSFVKLRLSLW